jgi:hypothetical protein
LASTASNRLMKSLNALVQARGLSFRCCFHGNSAGGNGHAGT